MKSQNRVLENIFEYDNYRSFLKDFLNEQKKISKMFSLRFFAQKAGFATHSFFNYVIKGERNLTQDSVEKFIKGLGLKGKLSSYFKNLVFYNQAKTSDKKQSYFREMNKIRQMASFFTLEKPQHGYFLKWYYPVLREAVCFYNWKKDYRVLGKFINPQITQKEAQNGVEFLLQANLIEKKDNGNFVQKSDYICSNGVPPAFVRLFRNSMMMHAINASDSMPVQERHFSTATITLSKKKFLEVQNLLDEVRKKIVVSSSEDDNDKYEKVYQLNMQLFPVSKKI